MAVLSDTQKAGAGAALLVVAGLLAYGLASPGPEAPAGHVAIYQDGGLPAGAVGVWATVLVDSQAQSLFGFDAGFLTLGDGGQGGPARPLLYARARVCALEVDGGVAPGPDLLPGLHVVYDDDQVAPCSSTDPALEAWVQGHPAAPWLCACCPRGSTCMGAQHSMSGPVTWGPASPALTYGPGQWATDGGWAGKPCVELLNTTSMPEACQ